ncbi:MAG: peptidoglycan-binding domain-containing protein, partial [Myxococcota bacterium]
PALVELRDADGQLRAVLVRHVEDAGIQLEGLVPDQPVRVTRIRLEGRFRGNGYVAWRNYEGLPPVLRAGGSGDPVRFVQRSLSRLGFYAGDVHGSFDPATEKAVVAFQDGSGIATDGALGPVSQVHLYQSLPDYRMPTLALGAVRAAVD